MPHLPGDPPSSGFISPLPWVILEASSALWPEWRGSPKAAVSPDPPQPIKGPGNSSSLFLTYFCPGKGQMETGWWMLGCPGKIHPSSGAFHSRSMHVSPFSLGSEHSDL